MVAEGGGGGGDGGIAGGTECSNRVEHCQTMGCDNSQRPVCQTCYEYNVRGAEFSLTWPNGPHICNPTCSWIQHSCWPGSCGSTHLAQHCQCNKGFILDHTTKTTTCQLEKGPKLLICDFGIENQYGDISNFTSSSGCHSDKDIFVNFVPTAISLQMESMLTLNITVPVMPQITNFSMGVVSGNLTVTKISPSGAVSNVEMVALPGNGFCNRNFSQNNPSTAKVHCLTSFQLRNFKMEQGDRLCSQFHSYGGGYLKVKPVNSKPSPTQYYKPTASTETKCFQYDEIPPQHCSDISQCNFEPLQIIPALSDSPNITVVFAGWFDGAFNSNGTKENNGVESYEFVIHPMAVVGDMLQVDQTKTVYKFKSFNETSINLILSSVSGLHAVYLTVKDFAGNAQYARKFFLYDNSSLIEARNISLPQFISKTGHMNDPWYSNREDVCFTWYNLFMNTFLHTYLKPIKKDNVILDQYDHISGVLNINGTNNTNGIDHFVYQFQVNDGNISDETLVPSANNQTQCFQNIFKDGDSLKFWISARDILNKTLTKNITVFIDQSAPAIEEFSLTKDGNRRLYMHNSSDLSSMVVHIDTIDEHSGLKRVQWILGTQDGSSDIGNGSLPVVKLANNMSCTLGTPCYCPYHGPCQMKNFTLTLNALIAANTHKGQHNRQYFVAIRVENMAGLFNEEHLDIVLDESPPIAGFIKEGINKYPDIDFTGSKILTVNWGGFVDHESDIYYYVIGMAGRCLTTAELVSRCSSCNMSYYIQNSTATSVEFSLKESGKYFSTIIAFNYAMEPSVAVCSDGVVYDETPPKLKDVRLTGAKTKETVSCHNGKTWRINFDLTKKLLSPSDPCFKNCSSAVSNPVLEILPERITDTMVKGNHCLTSLNNLIGIPSDNIHLSWKYIEEESEILDFFVGVSSSPQLKQQPDILAFTSTNQKPRFRKHRLGVKPGTRFYIFIKSINRALQSATTVVGPLVYDQTPPVYNGGLNVRLSNDSIHVLWQNNSFYDPEENSHLFITYQIKSSSSKNAVTPTRTIESRDVCLGGFPCIKLKIDQLGIIEPETNVSYYFEFHIFNMAGLFTTASSPLFHLPMKHPFNHGKVIDINPATQSTLLVHMHNSVNKSCVHLEEFHPSMKLLIGIGSNKFSADIVPFQSVTNRRRHCISSGNIRSFQKYFAVVNMTLHSRSKIVASDGFIIIDQHNMEKSVNIFNSHSKCSSNDTIDVAIHYNTKSKMFDVELLQDIKAGHQYMLGFKTADGHFDVIGDEIKPLTNQLIKFNNTRYQSFIALSSKTTFQVKFNPGLASHNKVSQPILSSCPISVDFQTSRHEMTANWEILGMYSQYVTHFELSLVDRTCLNKGGKICSVMNSRHLGKVFSINQKNLDLISGHKYSFSIRACSGEAGCSKPVLSAGAIILDKTPAEGKLEARILTTKNGSEIQAEWERFQCIFGNSVTEPVLYKINVFNQNKTLIQPSRFISKIKHQNVFKTQIMLNYTLQGIETLTLTTYCMSGLSIETEVPLLLDNQSSRTSVDVCEFRTDIAASINLMSVTDATTVDRFCSHNETDFISAINGKVGAIVTEARIMVSDWFFMSVAEPPTEECSMTINCLKTLRSDAKSMIFETKDIPTNRIYYICVKGVKNLQSGESLPYGSCGDGFLLDSHPPVAGHVNIDNSYNSFLSTRQAIVIHWNGFSDKNSLFTNPIFPKVASYSYMIGSYRGSHDIAGPVDVGVTTQAVHQHLNVTQGQHIFVTVTASDLSGLSSSAVSESVIVDVTPPENGTLNIGTGNGHLRYIDTNELTIYWNGFTDPQSGITSRMLGIGTLPLQDNIVAFSEQFKEFSEIMDKSMLQDGHTYYATLKVINGAGLESSSVSEAFITDASPPTEGEVREIAATLMGDIDYQRDISQLQAEWFGFSDSHTGILFYRAGVGTAPLQDDVIRITTMGHKTSHVWKHAYTPGVKYYVTVEACNAALLCSQISSNGIIMDNSPPLSGSVEVGTDSRHTTYQAHQSSLDIQWIGFYDPHSSMHKFEYCIGKLAFTCDVLQWEPALLTTSVVALNLNLPLNTLLYVTVKGYNNVGLTSTGSSIGFYIDKTPPKVLMPPKVLNLEKMTPNGTVFYTRDSSVLSLEWSFEDHESPIVDQSLTLHPHHSATTFASEFKLPPMNNATLVLKGKDRLQDGLLYNVSMSACNAAGLCTFVSAVQQVYVDSTAPSVGHFKPDQLMWDTVSMNGKPLTRLNLTWYNFEDGESGINRYHLIIRRLDNQLVSQPVTASHRMAAKYQSTNIILNRHLVPTEQLILEILAENKVGLYSQVFKLTVEMLSSSRKGDYGLLDIQKHSCSFQYCNHDCTCAATGKKCSVLSKVSPKCQNLPQDNSSLSLKVWNNQGLVVSAKCISAEWKVNNISTIHRFQWSAGIKGSSVGDGIFDILQEDPWKDIGLQDHATYCLPKEQELQSTEEYVFYIRAWYSADQYRMFTSQESIKLDVTAPVVRRGASVRDTISGCGQEDVDYMTAVTTVAACWNGVFTERQSILTHFIVMAGTAPGYGDLIPAEIVAANISEKISQVKLEKGSRYYFTVVAVNNLGLFVSLTSDGFVFDDTPPFAGVVYNTDVYHSGRYQNLNKSLGISWHGFEDAHSAVKEYLVAMGPAKHSKPVSPFTSVGIATNHRFEPATLDQGSCYVGYVQAVDAAGQTSNISRCPEICVDRTPPVDFKCDRKNTLIEKEFEINKNSSEDQYRRVITALPLQLNKIYFMSFTIPSDSYRDNILLYIGDTLVYIPPKVISDTSLFKFHFKSRENGMKNISVQFNSLREMSSKLHMSIEECISVSFNRKNALELWQTSPTEISVSLQVEDPESDIRHIYIGAGTTPYGFQIYQQTQVSPSSQHSIYSESLSNGQEVYVTVQVENEAGLVATFTKSITVDITAPLVSVKDFVISQDETMTTQAEVKWEAKDQESGISECYYSIGNTDDYMAFVKKTQVAASKAIRSVLPAIDGNSVLININCTNKAGLAFTLISKPSKVVVPHDSTQVVIIPVNEWSHTNCCCVQTDQSQLKIDIKHSDLSQGDFMCRILENGKVYQDWASIGYRRQVTFKGLTLTDGNTYQAQIKHGHSMEQTKMLQSNQVVVDTSRPQLTGSPIDMKRLGEVIYEILWQEVFRRNQRQRMRYVLNIGSKEGGSNIIHKFETNDTSLKFQVKDTVSTIYISIMAVYETNMFNIFSTIQHLA
ncbi:uncharacterized protein LOC115216576 [Argonauta hians]